MNVFDVPSDPAFWQAPYPFYAEALRSGDGLFAFSSGGYSVLSYDALYEIGRDPRAQGHPFPEGGLGPELDNLYRLLRWGLFALGSPHHRPLRMAAISGLSTLKPELVRAISRDVADQLAQRIFARGGGDLLADITLPLAARVSCRLSGIPKSEAPHVVSHIEVITHQLNGVPVAPADADHAARELYALLERSASGGQSALVDAVAAKLPPGSPATAVDIVASFMFDAVEMVSAGLFSALDCLGDQPGLTERVRSGEWDLGAAVQE
ncbi:MAG: hypothetical protein GX970_08970, partial [Phyllobacteriaceae bacterium]|nr:hypothetical protein [Phyllobacteriaceae bacterium]